MKRVVGPISAVVAAAVIAAAITMPAASEKVGTSPPAGADSYRDTQSFGTVCSEQAWPYIAANCLSDTRMATGKPATARVVTSDRFHLSATR